MPSNIARSVAIIAIVMHHWLNLPSDDSTFMSGSLSGLEQITGTFVHVFFVLSGYGLLLSHYKTPRSWGKWAAHRARKILFPYWIIVLLTFFLANATGHDYSWRTLLAYLTLTRNFYDPSWSLNMTLWFMPVIAGLYLCFPVLVKVLELYGSRVLLGTSAIITYGYIIICIAFGRMPEHQNAFFLAHLIEFSLGMALARVSVTKPCQFNWLDTPKAFWGGAFVYGLSAIISVKWEYGPFFNDILTALGLSAMFMGGGRIMAKANLWKVSARLAEASYIIYLTHFPVIIFLVKPVWNEHMSALWTLFCGIVFALLISSFFTLAYAVGKTCTLTFEPAQETDHEDAGNCRGGGTSYK